MVSHKWSIDEGKFNDVTFLLSFRVKHKKYLLIAQEGLIIKLVELDEDIDES